MEEFSSKVNAPKGIFENPSEETKSRGILRNSMGIFFLILEGK